VDPARLSLPEGFIPVLFDTIDSTSDEAKRRIRGGELPDDACLVILAARQTAGRGRQARRWVSTPGNLHMTVVLPAPPSERAGQLALVAAVAVGEAVTRALPGTLAIRYKWPNDLLCRGAKLGGLLVEAEDGPKGRRCALGIGINVAHAPEGLPATSLAREGASGASAEALAGPICASLSDWLARWESQGVAPIRANWLAAAEGLGRSMVARLPGGAVEGVFAGLDEDGRLILSAGGTERRIAAGDVFFEAA